MDGVWPAFTDPSRKVTVPGVASSRDAERGARSAVTGYALGASQVDFEARIDFSALRQQRVEKARAQMVSENLDGLLVWKDENVRYLTGLRAQLIAGKSSALNAVLL